MGTLCSRSTRLFLTMGHISGLVKWPLGVMCFSRGMGIEWLQVNGTSWIAIILGADDHSMAPCHRFAHWRRFDHTKPDILVQAALNIIPPVEGDWYGGVAWHRLGLWVYHEFQKGALHHREGLMLARVKCARLVVVDQVLLHLVTVLLRRMEMWLDWSGGGSWRLGQSQLTARPLPPLMGAWSSSKVAAVGGLYLSGLHNVAHHIFAGES